jgi:hypothetical protein
MFTCPRLVHHGYGASDKSEDASDTDSCLTLDLVDLSDAFRTGFLTESSDSAGDLRA